MSETGGGPLTRFLFTLRPIFAPVVLAKARLASTLGAFLDDSALGGVTARNWKMTNDKVGERSA